MADQSDITAFDDTAGHRIAGPDVGPDLGRRIVRRTRGTETRASKVRRRLLAACLALVIVGAGSLAAPGTASASFWNGSGWSDLKVIANTKLQASLLSCGDRGNDLVVQMTGQMWSQQNVYGGYDPGSYPANPYVYARIWVQDVRSGTWIHTDFLQTSPYDFAKVIPVGGVTHGQKVVQIEYAVWNGSAYVYDWEWFPVYTQVQYTPNPYFPTFRSQDLRSTVRSSTCYA